MCRADDGKMIDTTTAYFRNLELTGDAQAAVTLTLAEVMQDERKPAQPDNATWMTVDQAGKQLGVSRRTITDLCSSGKLPHVRIGNGRGTIRIKPADLDKIKPASVEKRKPFHATIAMLERA
jgi:excisionase family DNA binding protein